MTLDREYGTIERKRKFNIIKYLLNNPVIIQPELIKILCEMNIIPRTNRAQLLNPLILELEKCGIIERSTISRLGERDVKEIRIIGSFEAMIKIIEEISTLESYAILNIYKKEFINSEYAQNLTNDEFITLIERKLNEYINTDTLNFSDEERQIILNILQTSFSAIYYAIFESKMFSWFVIDSDSDIEGIKRLFIEYLILRLGDDTLSRITNKAKKFNYEIGINFSDIETIQPKLVINGDEVKSNYHHSYEDPDDTL